MSLKSILITLGLLSPPTAPPPPPSIPLNCINTCVVSDSGYDLIRSFEGYMPFPYNDIAGIKTVGYGHVILPGDKFDYPLLPAEAYSLLKKTMAKFQREINSLVRISTSQNQFDALASITYNIGPAALKSSTLLKRVNARRHTDVPSCFLMWNKARVGGVLQPVKGLTLRRQQEADLYAGK